MRIIVDAFGGDNAPLEVIKGAAMAVAEYGHTVVLVGREEEIRRVARKAFEIAGKRRKKVTGVGWLPR